MGKLALDAVSAALLLLPVAADFCLVPEVTEGSIEVECIGTSQMTHRPIFLLWALGPPTRRPWAWLIKWDKGICGCELGLIFHGVVGMIGGGEYMLLVAEVGIGAPGGPVGGR